MQKSHIKLNKSKKRDPLLFCKNNNDGQPKDKYLIDIFKISGKNREKIKFN